MRLRLAPALLAGVLLAGPIAACGGGDDKDDTKTTTEQDAPDVDETSDEGTGVSNPELRAYCDAVEDYLADAIPAIEQAKETRDPAALQALQPKGEELSRQADELQPTLSEADYPDLVACSQQLGEVSQKMAEAFGGYSDMGAGQ